MSFPHLCPIGAHMSPLPSPHPPVPYPNYVLSSLNCALSPSMLFLSRTRFSHGPLSHPLFSHALFLPMPSSKLFQSFRITAKPTVLSQIATLGPPAGRRGCGSLGQSFGQVPSPHNATLFLHVLSALFALPALSLQGPHNNGHNGNNGSGGQAALRHERVSRQHTAAQLCGKWLVQDWTLS